MRFSVLFLFAVLGYAAARLQVPVPVPVVPFPVVPVPGTVHTSVEPLPTGPYRIIPATYREEVRDDAGQYSLAYRSEDGGAQSSYGVLRQNPDGPGHFLAIEGSYSYTAPDGTPVYVSYIADEKGFRIINESPKLLPVVA